MNENHHSYFAEPRCDPDVLAVCISLFGKRVPTPEDIGYLLIDSEVLGPWIVFHSVLLRI